MQVANEQLGEESCRIEQDAAHLGNEELRTEMVHLQAKLQLMEHLERMPDGWNQGCLIVIGFWRSGTDDIQCKKGLYSPVCDTPAFAPTEGLTTIGQRCLPDYQEWSSWWCTCCFQWSCDCYSRDECSTIFCCVCPNNCI